MVWPYGRRAAPHTPHATRPGCCCCWSAHATNPLPPPPPHTVTVTVRTGRRIGTQRSLVLSDAATETRDSCSTWASRGTAGASARAAATGTQHSHSLGHVGCRNTVAARHRAPGLLHEEWWPAAAGRALPPAAARALQQVLTAWPGLRRTSSGPAVGRDTHSSETKSKQEDKLTIFCLLVA